MEVEIGPEQEAAAKGLVRKYMEIKNKLAEIGYEWGSVALAESNEEIDNKKAQAQYEKLQKEDKGSSLVEERDKVLNELSEMFGETGIMRSKTQKFHQENESAILDKEPAEFTYTLLEKLSKDIQILEVEHYPEAKGFEDRRSLRETDYKEGTIPEELTAAIEKLKQEAIAKGIDEDKVDLVIEVRKRNLMTSLNGD
ncbi:MAG: hypothetical protein CMI53_04615 [Parcubacteria group bacterium]|jgi:hypothetical protein|nr:hypothetical protein [Parcubacteria group bacterium]|tara:strand:- start:534 stop:1124 length:591 start_codon:yes stop_codon:yes gene_type:complete